MSEDKNPKPRWAVAVQLKSGKKQYLGAFHTEEEANAAGREAHQAEADKLAEIERRKQLKQNKP